MDFKKHKTLIIIVLVVLLIVFAITSGEDFIKGFKDGMQGK